MLSFGLSKDNQLMLLDKFVLESQIVHGGDNVPENLNTYLDLISL